MQFLRQNEQGAEFQSNYLPWITWFSSASNLHDVKKRSVLFYTTYHKALIESKENQHLDSQELCEGTATAQVLPRQTVK